MHTGTWCAAGGLVLVIVDTRDEKPSRRLTLNLTLMITLPLTLALALTLPLRHYHPEPHSL